MKRFATLLLFLLAVVPAHADVIVTRALSKAMADTLYCQLVGCTMTGNLGIRSQYIQTIALQTNTTQLGVARLIGFGQGTSGGYTGIVTSVNAVLSGSPGSFLYNLDDTARSGWRTSMQTDGGGIDAWTILRAPASANPPTFAELLRIDSTGQVYAINGTAAAPAYSFLNYPTTGMGILGTNILGLSTAGVEALRFTAAQLANFAGSVTVGAGGTGTDAKSITVNSGSGSGGYSGINFQRNTVVKALANVSGSAGQFLTGDAVNDFDFGSSQAVNFTADAATIEAQLLAGSFALKAADKFAWSSTAAANGTLDTFLTRRGVATSQHGAADAASPVAQTIAFQGSRGATDSNTAGGDATFQGSLGTGNAAGSQLVFKTGTPQASGTAQHVANSALTIKDYGLSNVQRSIITNPAGSMHVADGNTFRVSGSDFTTASASFVTITGLSWTMPANRATNISFRCEILYSQATAAVANQFGIQDVSVAPTNIMVKANVMTSTSVQVAANVPTLAATTATSIITFTPSAITTIWNAEIRGFIEQPSNAAESVINMLVLTGNASDSITVKRGSHCVVF